MCLDEPAEALHFNYYITEFQFPTTSKRIERCPERGFFIQVPTARKHKLLHFYPASRFLEAWVTSVIRSLIFIRKRNNLQLSNEWFHFCQMNSFFVRFLLGATTTVKKPACQKPTYQISLDLTWLTSRGAVAKSVECLSKVLVWCNSTVLTQVRIPRATILLRRGIGVRKFCR